MTTITLKIKDESKASDVLRFLRHIAFLEVVQPKGVSKNKGPGCVDQLLESPLTFKGFKPMSREIAHER